MNESADFRQAYLLSFFLLFVIIGNAQDTSLNYSYRHSDQDSLLTFIADANEKQIDRLKGPHLKKKRKLYEEKEKGLNKQIRDSQYVFNSVLNAKLTPILKEIYASNKDIDPSGHYFLMNASPVPNAACYGDGLFSLNLGLLSILENDDELAFILCHEMAHLYLDHVGKNINNAIDMLNSSEVEKRAKRIKRQRYGTTRQGLKLLEELSYDILDHSRKAEAQADSLGYVFFSKTKYNPKASITSLQKLGDLEDMIFSDSVAIAPMFDLEAYPFRKAWLKKEETFFNTTEKIDDYEWNKDSLKTHPDIPYRIEQINKHFKVTEGPGHKDYFNAINEPFRLLAPQIYNDLKRFDFSIYYLLRNLEEDPGNRSYYLSMLAQTMAEVYKAKKKHEFGKYVPVTSPFSEEKHLNTIRQFLHNLELKHIRKIGYYFCQVHYETCKDIETFSTTYDFFKTLNE